MAFASMTQSGKKSGYKPIDDKTLHSAAIIDADGHEVAITSEMIDRACEKLAKNIEQFQHSPEGKS